MNDLAVSKARVTEKKLKEIDMVMISNILILLNCHFKNVIFPKF
jgi:hypothetical protein